MKNLVKLSILAVLILVLVFAASCKPQENPRIFPNKTTEIIEITKTDVLDLIDKDLINSSYIAVKGVRLGDNEEVVISRLGRPAGFESLEKGTLNLRFEDPNTKATEMIVHLDNNIVTRIAIKEGLRDELINKSQFNFTKELATESFGKPDRMYDTQFYHIYEYNDHGFEVYFKARKMVGYGFVPAK